MEAIRTQDRRIWLTVGKVKRSLIAANWGGDIRRLSKPYLKGSVSIDRAEWIKARKFYVFGCCTNGSQHDWIMALRKVIQYKAFLAKKHLTRAK